MTKIKLSPKIISDYPAKYVRLVLTEKNASTQKLIEKTDGYTELHLGVGKSSEITPRKFRQIIRTTVQAANKHQMEHLVLSANFNEFQQLKSMGEVWISQTLATNLTLAAYKFLTYKTKKNNQPSLKEILVSDITSATAKKSFSEGLAIAEATNTARDIANTAGDDMPPSKLALATKKALSGTSATVKVLNATQIKQQKMGLLEAVGKGASDKPRFIVIEYFGTNKKEKPTILVGKGITYDSGGLNIKPSGSMHEMHLDMSGGAAVIGALRATAKLKLKKNVVGLIPAAENSVSATSMRAGDIATSMNGQTVEILHTDAEGRLVLADALTYAQKHYRPKQIIDIATLTGAALVALGQHASAVLTKNDSLRTTIIELGEETGELMWPLPLWDEYKHYLKSDRADISNIATNFSRYGGTIEGGTFLSFFVDKKIPWAHIDIAPRMESIASDKLAKGSTGEPVQLLVQLIKQS